MFSLFRRTAQRVGEASAIADMERHSGLYRMAGPTEAAGLRANAAVAFRIVADFAEKASIAEDIFDNLCPLQSDESARVSAFILSLTRARDKLFQQGDLRSTLFANGLTTWVLSLRAFTYPVLLPMVREMWQHIERGEPEYQQTLTEYEAAGVPIGTAWMFEPPPACQPR